MKCHPRVIVCLSAMNAFRFHTPSSVLIVDSSGCGKIVFTARLLSDQLDLFEDSLRILHYCYGAWQPGFRRLQKRGLQFHEGVPDVESLSNWFPRGGVLILDDLMAEGSNDKNVLICSPNTCTIETSPSSTCAKTCSSRQIRQEHLQERALHRGLQEPPRSIGQEERVVASVSPSMERHPTHVSDGDGPTLWVPGVRSASQEPRRQTRGEPST